MTNTKQLLEIKKAKKKGQPEFLRRNFKKNKRARVSGNWKSPRGLHNKLRRRRRGIGQWVMPGYRMPRKVRGLTTEGLLPVLVENIEQLKKLIAEKHIIILKSSMGIKKRIVVVKEALKKNLKILNVKAPDEWLKKVEKVLEEKKSAKEKKKKQKEEKTAEEKATGKKKEEEKKEKEDKDKIAPSQEEQKEQKTEEKKELDKLLTKKE